MTDKTGKSSNDIYLRRNCKTIWYDKTFSFTLFSRVLVEFLTPKIFV